MSEELIKGKETITCPERTKNSGNPDSCCNHWWDGPDESGEAI